MNSKHLDALSAAAAAFLLSVAGCGEKPDAKQATPSAPGPAPAVAPAPASGDALGPRYEASMAEGIDFTKPGYPSFVAEVQGMAAREDWGRWTDARLAPGAKFRFRQPLPNKFTLVIKAGAFSTNLNKPVIVRVGGVEKTFVHKNGAAPDTYRLAFELPATADTIEIVPPQPASPQELSPSNRDQRKLGVGMVRLQVES